VKQGINAWMTAAGVEDGRLLRAVWSAVEQCAKQIEIERFGAHDLRRTRAKLCRKNGGGME
jgi:integrase